jgi:hypothetical protein
MRHLCLLLAAACSVPETRAAVPADKHEGELLVLGIALNQFPDKKNKETIASFNYCAEEFTRALREGGKMVYREVEARTVLGRQATLPRCQAELARLAQKAERQDVVVLGIFGHGLTHPKEGWGFETADRQTLWGHQIKTLLGRLPCSAVVVVETSTSAAFAKTKRKDATLPANVTALCACRGRRQADNHLSLAVAEALGGKADFDKDGIVEAAELVTYVRRRLKELASDGRVGKDGEPPLLVEAKAGPPRLPLTAVSADLVAVAVEGEWYQARFLKKGENGSFRIRPLGWDAKPGPNFLADEVDRDHICLPTDPPPIRVEIKGKKRLARLVSKDGDRWKVQYLGAKAEDTVAKSSVTQLFGEENVPAKKRKKK